MRREPGPEEIADPAALRNRLGHVCWIKGCSGAGKSTIARRVAVRHRILGADVLGTGPGSDGERRGPAEAGGNPAGLAG
jgi:ABC-type iron transport system FetAB ATPase subunit